MDLPVYKCVINPDDNSPLEVQAVALVDQPAIEKNFMAFNSMKPLSFAINPDRQIISGPAMLADMPIYRKDPENGEYFVTFDKATIQCIVEKFFAKGLMTSFNIMHDGNYPADGTCIFESFITDATRGIQPMKGFEDVPDGSWFISCKINDPATWQLVKDGTVKGFSVEGIFSMLPVRMNKPKLTLEEKWAMIEKLLSETHEEN